MNISYIDKSFSIIGAYVVKIFLKILWILLTLISLNHLYDFYNYPLLSIESLGVLFGSTLVLSLIYFSRKFLKQTLFIFFTFLILGYYVGAFIEPPADPLYHLNKSYSFRNGSFHQFKPMSAGLWHYSLNSIFLPKSSGPDEENFNSNLTPEKVIFRIDLLNGFYWGLLSVCLYILAKAAGLTDKWALLSILICFLFYGTNRFSYFRYYSFAPTFSSMMIFWLWTAIFFFNRNFKSVLNGLAAALICFPILVVNHLQEAFFLALILAIWLFININEILWPKLPIKLRVLYVFGLFGVLFLIPQFEFFRLITSKVLIQNFWSKNTELYYSIHGFKLFGKIFGYRVEDTLGLLGFLPLFFIILLFAPHLLGIKKRSEYRVIVLGLIPFIGYWIPLINFFWISNVKLRVYYRLCYSSMFWITLAFGLCKVENTIIAWTGKRKDKISKGRFDQYVSFILRKYCFVVCIALFIALSMIRSGPVYGKMDFISLNARPWWPQWKNMIADQLKMKRKKIFSDPQTIAVLYGVFNLPSYTDLLYQRVRDTDRDPKSIIYLKDVKKFVKTHDYRCIINLQSFRSSWVPEETGHWKAGIGQTSLYYQMNGLTGDELREYLMQNPPEECEVYY